MTARRRGVTLVEILIATSIVGILTGIAVPTVVGVRRTTIAQTALTALRAVDVAVNASCGRGTCGPFIDSGSVSTVATRVPAVLKQFLPAGFAFAHDTGSWALQLETWTVGSYATAPLCVTSCSTGTGSSPDDPGFSNTAGFTAPPTITVSVSIITADGNVAQALYDRAGGAPPTFISSQHVWKYSYPVLVAVPATG